MIKKENAEKGLIFGIGSIIVGLYFFSATLFTFKSSLIKQKGIIEEVNVNYIEVTSRNLTSVKSEIKFSFKSNNSVYVLMENIGQSGYNEVFEKLAQELKQSKKATVWIKESQKTEERPTVFQIADRNDKIIYDFNQAKSLSLFGFLVTFVVGLFGIGIYVYYYLRIKPAHNSG